MCTKVFLIAIAVFIFWGGAAEAKDNSPKQADTFDWKSSPLIHPSTVDILKQHRLLGISAVQGRHLGASLHSAGSEVASVRLSKGDSQKKAKRTGVIVGQLAVSGALAFGASIPFIVPFFDGAIEYSETISLVTASSLGYLFLSTGAVYGIGKLAGYDGSFWKTLVYGGVLPIGLGMVLVGPTEWDTLGGIPYGVSGGSFTHKIFYWYGGAILGIWSSPVFETLVYHLTDHKLSAVVCLDRHIQFGLPKLQMQVSQILNHYPETNYTLHLVSMKF